MDAEAIVVAGHGRDCLVESRGALRHAKARSRDVQPVAGDRVLLADGIIEALAPRASVFARASRHRTKVIAANATQVVAVAACEPPFSDELLCRLAVAAHAAGLPIAFLLNKTDLAHALPAARAMLAPFRDAGHAVAEVSAHHDITALRALLEGHCSVLVGQSGMGKSTLVKTLVPDADVRIREISRFLSSGRHSTTASRLHWLGPSTSIIDTPGIAEFGLAGLGAAAIAAGFREFAAWSGRCRFHDCRHLGEPGCAVRAAPVHPRRLVLYERILRAELPA